MPAVVVAQRRVRIAFERTVARPHAAAPAQHQELQSRPASPVSTAVQLLPAAAPAAPDPVPAAIAQRANAMQLRGDYWDVHYDGRSALLEDCRGLRYIALVIRDAGPGRRPIHAKELVALATGGPSHGSEPLELETRDALLDDKARRQFAARLEAIADERSQASALNDIARLVALDDECDRIAGELSRAGAPRAGRGGSSFNHAGEKARKAVGKAISEAVTRIASHRELAPLAQHLSTAVQKGQWLSFSDSAAWIIEFQAPLPRK